jgi:Tfp pilus assembly protein PilF
VPEAAELEQLLGRFQRGEQDQGEARLVHAGHQDHPDAPMIREALVRGYLATFRLNDALACLNYWLEREPENIQALLWRADIYERRLSHENALADYRRASALDPDRPDIRQEFAHALLEARQPAEALEQLSVLHEAMPTDPTILLWLARAKHMTGDSQAAEGLLDQLLEAQSNDSRALTERGKLAFEGGRASQAEVWLKRAVELAPSDREALFTLVQVFRQNGKESEAKTFQARLLKLDADLDRAAVLAQSIAGSPHDAALRHEMALIFLSKGETREGVRWLQSALREDPLYRPALKTLAEQSRKADPSSQSARAN